MDTINDQKNIKRIHEWDKIRKEMEAGSNGLTQENINYFEDKSSMASILHELKKELQTQEESLAEFEKQDWDDQGEDLTRGWCEALEFAIKLLEGKDVQNTND